MNEPITISEEAKKAAHELCSWTVYQRNPDGSLTKFENGPMSERLIQNVINSATAPLQNRIEELEKSSAEYIAQTDPLLSCVNPSDEKPHCGVCRVCLFEKVDSLEKQLLAMGEALNWFELWFKDNSGGGKLGCPWCYASSYNDDNGWREFKHSADCLIGKALNSTPDDLARKYVKREVLEKCVELSDQIVNAIPCTQGGSCFYPVHDGEGNYIGEQNVDPIGVIQTMHSLAMDMSTLARKELEK